MFDGLVQADYQMRRMHIATRLNARLAAAPTPARAVRAAAKSVKARCDAARKAIGESLESQPGAVASPAELASLFDDLVGGEIVSCIDAVATVAGRWESPTMTMAATEAAVVRAHARARADVLRHLADDANESQLRLRPFPVRLARSGVNALLGGGLLWRGWLWVTQNWPQIAAHFHH
jgi:hypothetical protein